MVYIDITAQLYATTKTITDMGNTAITTLHANPTEPLKAIEYIRAPRNNGGNTYGNNIRWSGPTSTQRDEKMSCNYIQLNDFLYVLQGGPQEQTHMLWHLSTTVDQVFCPNTAADTPRKEPIFSNKLRQGEVA